MIMLTGQDFGICDTYMGKYKKTDMGHTFYQVIFPTTCPKLVFYLNRMKDC